MKSKTINAIISSKFKNWLDSIQDPKVKEMVKNNTIMTGGAIASMLLKEEINDFDFYFRDIETTAAVARYYVNQFKANPPAKVSDTRPVNLVVQVDKDRVQIHIQSSGVVSEESSTTPYNYFEQTNPEDAEAEQYLNKLADTTKSETKPKYRPIYLTSNAITLSDDVQIVIRFFGEPNQIHENYDYVHCTNYWTSWTQADGKKLVLRAEALESLLTKELRYVGSKYPLCSLIRLRKFIGRGWTVNAGQILKIALQLQDLNLHDSAVLQEQLTGVDIAYFRQLLAAVEKDAKAGVNIDGMYLVQLIDKLF